MTTGGPADPPEGIFDPLDSTHFGSAGESAVTADLDAPKAPKSLGSSVRPALKWSFVNTGGIKVVGLLSTVILARLLSPHDYGVFAIAFVALNLADSINDAGLQAAITRWPGEIDSVAPTAVTICIAASIVCYGVLFFLAPFICAALNAPETTDMLRVLCIILILNGFDAVPAAVLSRNFRQDRQAIADIVASGSVLLTILLAYLGYGAWSFVWGQLAGNLIDTVLIICFAPIRYWPGFNRGLPGAAPPGSSARGLGDCHDRCSERRLHHRWTSAGVGATRPLSLRLQHFQLATDLVSCYPSRLTSGICQAAARSRSAEFRLRQGDSAPDGYLGSHLCAHRCLVGSSA